MDCIYVRVDRNYVNLWCLFVTAHYSRFFLRFLDNIWQFLSKKSILGLKPWILGFQCLWIDVRKDGKYVNLCCLLVKTRYSCSFYGFWILFGNFIEKVKFGPILGPKPWILGFQCLYIYVRDDRNDLNLCCLFVKPCYSCFFCRSWIIFGSFYRKCEIWANFGRMFGPKHGF